MRSITFSFHKLFFPYQAPTYLNTFEKSYVEQTAQV